MTILVHSLLAALQSSVASLWPHVPDLAARQEAQQRVRELEALFATSTALRAARNDDEMIPIILDKTLEVMKAQDGVVALLGHERLVYAVRLARGYMQAAQGKVFPANDSLWDQAVNLGEPHVTQDLTADLRDGPLACTGKLGPGVLAPLKSATETLGFLLIGRREARAFSSEEVGILTAIAETAGSALHRARLHKELEESYLGTVLALANAVDAKDTYTGGHSGRLAEMAVAVGHHMHLNNGFVEDLRWGAILHDIGKIGIPDNILRKPSALTTEEWAVIRQHPVIGAQILAPVPKLARAALIVRHHHEWWNGQGYPDHLTDEAIPLGARILSVVDAYSAITDDRVYKRGVSHEQALRELQRCTGTQFDPQIVAIFLQIAV